jgi:hypothetical protein
MKIAFLFCLTAIAIVFIHDVVGPVLLLDMQLELTRAVERIYKKSDKPSIEIIPSAPKFRATPELRKEKLMTKKATKHQYAVTNSLILAGELMGLAYKLDARALEKFLESPSPDFRYEKECRAAIEFRKAVHG